MDERIQIRQLKRILVMIIMEDELKDKRYDEAERENVRLTEELREAKEEIGILTERESQFKGTMNNMAAMLRSIDEIATNMGCDGRSGAVESLANVAKRQRLIVEAAKNAIAWCSGPTDDPEKSAANAIRLMKESIDAATEGAE